MAPIDNQSREIAERDALYYPYIHIRSVDWLKRTLLIFPHVARIVPRGFLPDDRKELRSFEDALGRWQKPLLRSANLGSPGVFLAQNELISLLATDIGGSRNYLRKFTFENYASHIRGPEDEFLLHPDKPTYELINFLERTDLMWHARFAGRSGFVAVHPAIGELVMSTIALACANDEGFDVVTDEGRAHYDGGTVENLYLSLVDDPPAQSRKQRATEKELCELIIFQQCNVGELTASRIAELSKDREAIDAFRTAMADIAATIPEMQDDSAFQDRLRSAVDEALRMWRNDRKNMSKISNEILGRDLIHPTEGFVKTLVEKFLPPLVGAGAGAAASGDARGVLIGAVGGFVVALLTHSVSSWGRVSDRERKSAYRYLTNLEKAGVSFTVAK